MAWTEKVTAAAVFASSLVLLSASTMAQSAATPTKPSTPSSPDPGPDTTTATFGDWTLRCDRRLDLTPPQRVCELGMVVQKQGETAAQAQFALGRVARGEALRITAVLPPNIAIKSNPKVVVDGKD